MVDLRKLDFKNILKKRIQEIDDKNNGKIFKDIQHDQNCDDVENGIKNMVKDIFKSSVIPNRMYNDFSPIIYVNDKQWHPRNVCWKPIISKIIEMGDLGGGPLHIDPVVKTHWLDEEPKISVVYSDTKSDTEIHRLKIHFHDYCRGAPVNLVRVTRKLEQLTEIVKKMNDKLDFFQKQLDEFTEQRYQEDLLVLNSFTELNPIGAPLHGVSSARLNSPEDSDI